MRTNEKQFSPVTLAQSLDAADHDVGPRAAMVVTEGGDGAVGGQQKRRTSKLVSIARAQWLCLLCWGGFSVCFGQAPPNDNFTNAIPLYGNSLTFTGTLANSTYEPGESAWGGGSVWWSWTPTNSTAVVIDTVAVSGNTSGEFAVYTATNVTDITYGSELAWNSLDRIPNRYACFMATAGTTYHIRAFGVGDSFTLRLTATNAPVILAQPESRTVAAFSSTVFNVVAAGLRPLEYQWQFEGSDLPGETKPILLLHGVATNQVGGYSVIVSNTSGVTTSAVANLTISPPNPPDYSNAAICIAQLEAYNCAVKLYAIELKLPSSSPWTFSDMYAYLKNPPTCPSGGVYSPGATVSDVPTCSLAVLPVPHRLPPENDPLIMVQPQSQTKYIGATVVFTVSTRGLKPMVFQWQENGTNLIDGGNISGANADTLTITSISDSDVANYSVIVSNSYNSVTSFIAVLTVDNFPFIATQPLSQTVGVGSNVTLNVTAYGAPPFVFQWYYNNAPAGSPTSGTNVSSYTLTNVQTNQSGNYRVLVINGYGSVMSSNAVLTVTVFPPSIEVQPASQSVIVGGNVTFAVFVNGTPPFSYQWRFNESDILNATNGTYAIQAAGTNRAGNYSVVVTNSVGSVTSSNAVLTVLVPPSIEIQPASQSVAVGSNVTFNVSVNGTAPFGFQWRFNGDNIPDATNADFVIQAVVATNTGNYSVVVANSAGSVTSSNALLTVLGPPSIGVQPASQSVVVGGNVTFTVSVNGTPPFSYQWRFNESDILNATNDTYAIQAVGATNTGNYSVVVTNSAGSVTSSNALLTVLFPPTLTLEIWAGYPLLSLEGMLSNDFVVQYSTNLGDTNWINLLFIPNLPASPYLFLDPAGAGQPARFYRAFMQ